MHIQGENETERGARRAKEEIKKEKGRARVRVSSSGMSQNMRRLRMSYNSIPNVIRAVWSSTLMGS